MLSDSIHEKLSSTLIGNNDDVQFNVISNVSMVNCNDLAPSSSINSFSSSIYVTQEANTISMVLGDSPELRKYDRTKQLYQQSNNSDIFVYNMLSIVFTCTK